MRPSGVVVLGAWGLLMAGGSALAQAPQPAVGDAPAPLAAPAPTPGVEPLSGHPVAPHHRPRHHRRRLAVQPPATSVAGGTPSGQEVAAGTTPAPVPNEDIGPPRLPQDSAGNVTGGSMSIHYPPTGDGFLPGSSSSDMDNRTTPSVPGVQYEKPLANPAPEALPEPEPAPSPGH